MKITDFASLKLAIGRWMARENSTRFLDEIDLFIQLTESEINDRLRVADQETEAQLTIPADAKSIVLPIDFGGLRGLPTLNGVNIGPLTFLVPSKFDSIYVDQSFRDIPRAYMLRALKLFVKPIPSVETKIDIVYHKGVPALDTTTTTNWLITKRPNIYLAGTMMQAHSYMSSDKALMWAAKFDTAMENLEDADWNDKYSGSPIVSQPNKTEALGRIYPRARWVGT